MYKENPKTKGSGITCAIPQAGLCPNKCKDCFFQSGRSYLEPIEENTPNLPSALEALGRVIRVNDGNDSHNEMELVLKRTGMYAMRFYNTSCPDDLEKYNAPVVLTINPGAKTDADFHRIESPPPNLMFARFRTNTWNLSICDQAVEWYSDRQVPIVLTFMAYNNAEDVRHPSWFYSYRKRTLNQYHAITTDGWTYVMNRYRYNRWVYSCGREGVASGCRFCGNCLREYFATMERLHEQ